MTSRTASGWKAEAGHRSALGEQQVTHAVGEREDLTVDGDEQRSGRVPVLHRRRHAGQPVDGGHPVGRSTPVDDADVEQRRSIVDGDLTEVEVVIALVAEVETAAHAGMGGFDVLQEMDGAATGGRAGRR